MKLFLVSLIIFVFNQILQFYHISVLFTNSYLDDLLFFPISLSIIRYVQSIDNNDYEIPLFHIIIGLLFVSLIFELILPNYDSRFTADLYDIIFYTLGIGIYQFSRINYFNKTSYIKGLE